MLIKICGITRFQDAKMAIEKGATHLGFIFHPQSSRNITLKKAKTIINKIREVFSNHKIFITGVFVDQDLKSIKNHVAELKLDCVQLHGKSAKANLKDLNYLKDLDIRMLYVIDIIDGVINNLDKKNLKFLSVDDFVLFDLPKNNLKEIAAQASPARNDSSSDLPKNNLKEITTQAPPTRNDSSSDSFQISSGIHQNSNQNSNQNLNQNSNKNLLQKPNIQNIKKIIKKHKISNFFIAGNLSANNKEDKSQLTEIISKLNPAGLDFCSKLEEDKKAGTKSKKKLTNLFEFLNMSKNPKTKPGYFGEFGGQFVPEILIPALNQLEKSAKKIIHTKKFKDELNNLLTQYAGRSTPLTPAINLANYLNKKKPPKIYLKREDLLHTGAHKLNNAIGQCLLAKKMGKTRIIAETGAGQHGVATATACAYLDLECIVYMGSTDIKRQMPNVNKMKLLGAKVSAVEVGQATLKEAVNEALRDYATNFENTHYCLGSALGPHPYPELVAYFQKVIGSEVKAQCKKLKITPTHLIAPVGGGSNAIGLFKEFIPDTKIKMIGVEAGGICNKSNIKNKPGKHAARIDFGEPGILHGCYSYLIQDDHGQIQETHSISAGLDYPSIGPEHAYLHQIKRVKYTHASDKEALEGFKLLSQLEGIIPALESSHAIGYVIKNAKLFKAKDIIIINLSGRGDKDLDAVMPKLKIK